MHIAVVTIGAIGHVGIFGSVATLARRGHHANNTRAPRRMTAVAIRPMLARAVTADRTAEAPADWVLAVERAYVAAAVGPGGVAAQGTSPQEPVARAGTAVPENLPAALQVRAEAAAAAIASRFLAVAAPRSFGLVIDVASQVDAAALALAAHRTWFDPRDVRCAAVGAGAEALAAATGGRVVSIDEALACDIVCVLAAYARVTPARLRRGSHVNVAWGGVLDEALGALATVVREAELPAVAAGLVDGRQHDEITVFVINGAPTALAALAALTTPTGSRR